MRAAARLEAVSAVVVPTFTWLEAVPKVRVTVGWPLTVRLKLVPPVGVIATLVCWWAVTESKDPASTKLDVVGTVLVTSGSNISLASSPESPTFVIISTAASNNATR